MKHQNSDKSSPERPKCARPPHLVSTYSPSPTPSRNRTGTSPVLAAYRSQTDIRLLPRRSYFGHDLLGPGPRGQSFGSRTFPEMQVSKEWQWRTCNNDPVPNCKPSNQRMLQVPTRGESTIGLAVGRKGWGQQPTPRLMMRATLQPAQLQQLFAPSTRDMWVPYFRRFPFRIPRIHGCSQQNHHGQRRDVKRLCQEPTISTGILLRTVTARTRPVNGIHDQNSQGRIIMAFLGKHARADDGGQAQEIAQRGA